MRRRDVLASSALLAAAATTAEASAPPKKADPAGQYVDVPMTAIPVLDGRKLKNYVFVALRLNLTAKADMQKLRERAPHFRDAIVRMAHRAAYNPDGEWSKLDEPRFKAAVLAEAAKIAGPGMVASVKINNSAPQRRLPSRR